MLCIFFIFQRLAVKEFSFQTKYPATFTPTKCGVKRILGIIALVRVSPPIATHFSVAWSVCLSHLCSLLKPFEDLDAIWQLHLLGPMLVLGGDP